MQPRTAHDIAADLRHNAKAHYNHHITYIALVERQRALWDEAEQANLAREVVRLLAQSDRPGHAA